MHLLALIEKSDDVCYRYRVEAYRSSLAERGWSVHAMPVPHDVRDWCELLPEAAMADVVVLQRRLLPPWWRWALRQAAKRLIYDFDDAMLYRDNNARKKPVSGQRLRRFRGTVQMADAVTAGNRYLALRAMGVAEPGRVHHLPTCVEPARYTLARHERTGSAARLVWIGSRSTMTSLELAAPSLAAAGHTLGSLELHVICDQFPRLSGVRVVPRAWSSATEARDLASADIGISWLPDHPWSEGKCGLKVLQYMAAGLPVVANSVGMNREMVVDGETGFLVDSPAAWAAAIARLSADPPLRRQMGLRGRAFVERHFNAAAGASKFVDLLERLVGAGVGGQGSGGGVPQSGLNEHERREPLAV